MKRNMFYVWLAVAAMMFAIVSFGGCGGSSSSSNDGGGESDNTQPSMSDVWQDDEAAAEVVGRLNSGDAFLLLTVRMEAVEKKSDGSVTMKYYDIADSVFNDVDNPEVPYNAAEVLAHYNSEDIIVIMNTDLELVNTVRADLGLEAEDSGIMGQSGILEAYALACIRVDGFKNLFTYVVPRLGDIVSGDTIADQSTSGLDDTDSDDLVPGQTSRDAKPEVLPSAYTMRDFQIDRWVRFLQWMGNMGLEAVRNETSAVRAAASEEFTSIADAQTRTFDFSYTAWITAGGKDFKRVRTNMVSYRIFSAHSFSNGKDYYLVQCTTTTVPKNFTDTYISTDDGDWYYNYLCGYTRYVQTEQHIDDGNMSVNDVALYKNTPANLNEEKTYSDSTTWEVNGKVGVNKDGVAAEVGGGVSHTNSLTWSVKEYTIVNDSMKDYRASAKWYADVGTPDDGEKHYLGAPFRYYQGVNAKAASRNQLQFDSAWMWEVGRDYWRNHSTIRMNVAFTAWDGTTWGWSHYGLKYKDRSDRSFDVKKTGSLVLNQPTHTAISRRTFAFTSRAATAQQFTLLAEDSWNISGVPSWLHFTETSGSATGSTDKLLLFDVDENTSSSPRTAKLTLKSGRDTITLEVAQSGK